MALTGYEKIKRWRSKSKKNAEYKNAHRRKKRREFRRLLKEGKITLSQIPKSYNIRPLQVLSKEK